jgi:hypothetical protein
MRCGRGPQEASYLQAQFHRLRARRDAKKAIGALAASILTIVYHMLLDGELYHDLGPDHFDRPGQNRSDQTPRHAFAKSWLCRSDNSLGGVTPDRFLSSVRSCPFYGVPLCGYVFIGTLADASASTLDDQRRSTSLDPTWNGGAPTMVLTVRFGHILRRINPVVSQAILTVGGQALGVCPITAPEFIREPGLVCGSSVKLRGFGEARQFTPGGARGESQ